jgi:hypothetical protein
MQSRQNQGEVLEVLPYRGERRLGQGPKEAD